MRVDATVGIRDTPSTMDSWDELRTAFEVARLGTLSAASTALGLHRATVARHIEALEQRLGAKLFQRSARGYTPTEVGEDLLRVTSVVAEQFSDFESRTRGRSAELSGDLIVTSVELIAPPIVAACRRFRAENPKTRIRYRVSAELLKLEYGEAHVAVRAGPRPKHPDNVVQPFLTLHSGLYAHRDYIEGGGRPQSVAQLQGHDWVMPEVGHRAYPFSAWVREHVGSPRIAFESSNERILFQAIAAGLGLGFVPEPLARANAGLLEILAPRKVWDVNFWLVTHLDMHRSPKVQSFLQFAKDEARSFAIPKRG